LIFNPLMNNIRLLTPIILAVLASCGSNNTSEKWSEADFKFSYTVDTVMVDAGEHFFFLNWGLSLSDVSKDRKYLYNLNPQDLLLEVVDLDNLKFKEAIKLEKEGPNGVGGGNISSMQVLDNGNIMLYDFNTIFEITPKGELVEKFDFDSKNLNGYDLGEMSRLSHRGLFTGDGKTYAAPISGNSYPVSSKGLGILDKVTKELQFVPLDMFADLDKFQIALEMEGGGTMSTGESFFSQFVENQLFISNSAFNEVYVYDIEIDSLSHHTFNSQLTENARILNFPTNVTTREALFDASGEKNKQIQFGPFISDPAKSLYWRFSSEGKDNGDDTFSNDYYLTFFDMEFNMLKEQKIENFRGMPETFIKDGMLYTFLNIEDELAFIRLKPILEE
tara:strand:- start:787 stop:1956 length:1170 start_codon:yes stop_codon:yes gene_type:complete